MIVNNGVVCDAFNAIFPLLLCTEYLQYNFKW